MLLTELSFQQEEVFPSPALLSLISNLVERPGFGFWGQTLWCLGFTFGSVLRGSVLAGTTTEFACQVNALTPVLSFQLFSYHLFKSLSS